MALPYAKPVISPVLVGREPHLASLQSLLAQASDRQGQVVLVSGEAGVGKSRLLAEVRRHASSQRFLLLQGHAFEQDLSFPYAPLIDLLRGYGREHSQSLLEGWEPWKSELVKLLPELGVHGVQPTAPLEPETEKRRLFEALTQFLMQLSKEQPLLVIVEDIHWADETSLEWLHVFARRLAVHPVLLLASYRHEEVSSSLQHLLAKLDRERLAHEVRLEPLHRHEVEKMVRAIFELKRPVRAEFLDAIFELTEGNPFFIEEVLKSLVTAGEVYYTEAGWDRKPMAELHIPRSIQDAVGRRLARLSPAANNLAGLAAVAGRRFDFALLQTVTGHAEAALLQLMKELIAAQLVVEVSSERFAFRHALTREAVYKGLLVRERKALHQVVAKALERLHTAMPEPSLADLAYHFYEAEVWDKAFDYAVHAGERAQTLYAPQAATEHFNRALEAARQQRTTPPPGLYRARARAYDTLGNFEVAHADLETAIQLAQQTKERKVEWQALLDLGRLWAARDYLRSGTYFEQALTLARMLDDSALLAHSLNRLGNWHLNMDEPHTAIRHHQEALAIFEPLGDKRAIAETLDLLGVAYGTSDDQLRSITHFERSVAFFRELDDRRGWASCQINLAELRGQWFMYLTSTPMASDQETAVREGEEALALSRTIGWRVGEAWALMSLSGGCVFRGDYGRALAYARQGLELAEELGNRQWAALCHSSLGSLYLDLFATELAIRHTELGFALAKAMRSTLYCRFAGCLLARAHLLDGAHDEAQELLDGILPADAPMQTTGQRLLWTVRAELTMAQGKAARALDIVERLTETAPNMAPGRVIPYLWKLRGEALASLGRLSEAEAVLAATYQSSAAQERKPLEWRILASLARLHRAQTRFKEATACQQAAREIVDALASTVPNETLRDRFLRGAHALLPGPRQQRSADELTPREREVVILLSQAKSNKAIAKALDLSERTVEKHVSNILGKLELRSRAQVVVWAATKGLTKSAR